MHYRSPLSLGITPFWWKNSRGWQDKDTEETLSVYSYLFPTLSWQLFHVWATHVRRVLKTSLLKDY